MESWTLVLLWFVHTKRKGLLMCTLSAPLAVGMISDVAFALISL